MRTASTGLPPPLEPLLEPAPFELGDFAFEPDDFARDDFGFVDLFADPAFVALALAALGFAFDFDWFLDCDLGFDFDCDFDFVEEPALFDEDRLLDLVSAIFPLSSGSPY